MKISAITTHLLDHKLEQRFESASSGFDRRTHLLVEVSTDSGLTGWGECLGPARLNAAVVQGMAPLLIGQNPLETEKRWIEVYHAFRDQGQRGLTITALSGIDIALWDIRGKAWNAPISTLLGALNGYVVAQWRFKGANIIFSLMLFGCFIPFQVILLPMARLLGLMGIAGTIPGLIFVHVIYGIGFTTLFFRNYYVTIPSELVKAAKVDGANFLRIFWSIFLPLSLPIIVVTVIWQFTQIWNDFLFGVSFSQAGTQPVTVALNNIVNSTTGVKEYNVDMAAAIIAALPTLLVYVVAGKYFIRGLTAGSVKG